MKNEHCEETVESGEISLKSEIEAESIDCKETIKLEIKQEIQETEDVQDPLSTEDPFIDIEGKECEDCKDDNQ